MNPRIQQLRRQSLESQACISPERAELVTRFHQDNGHGNDSIPIQRALTFKYIFDHKSICINPGELIVGERGPGPQATPTYPEICLHSLKDLDILHQREKVSFKVGPQTKDIYDQKIIPFWKGKTIREKIFRHLPEQWKAAYKAGIFTEFQEQRSPGHTVLGDKIYRKGFLDIIAEVEQAIKKLDFYNDPEALDKREQLEAMRIAAQALITHAHRYAAQLDLLAAEEQDADRRSELIQMAHICRKVPADAPETFWEALQYYWFVHVGVITELNPWDAFNPGRLDQHLYPFYRREIDAGTLSRDQAKELLQAFWIKFNTHPAPPKVGVTAKESNTYVDFALINLGGVMPNGGDAVNELTYLMLDVIEDMRLLQPSSMILLSKKNPDRFLKRALRIIKTGFGQPSIFNAEEIIQELTRQGKSLYDARCGGASGCVESGAFGKECYILTGYFNLPKILELTLNNGVDPLSGSQIGLTTGNPAEFKSFAELFDAFSQQLQFFADLKIKGNNIIERINAKYMPVPFLSLLIDDCITQGKDYNAGGARYNTSYIQGVGLGSITDCLAAIKFHVYDQGAWTMTELLAALRDNFDGFDDLRDTLVNHTPKYGNDDDYADQVMQQVFESFYDAVDGRPNTKGGVYRINLLPTTVHVYFGSMTGALPDGRRSQQPLSEGISPVQGADRKGPTAVLKSASKIDHVRTGGTLLNQKFCPELLHNDNGISKVAQLVRSYFRMDGHHIQFNVVNAETLRQAQNRPDDYRDLIVRVAGYSDYFVNLTEALQEEIIRRTEHQGF